MRSNSCYIPKARKRETLMDKTIMGSALRAAAGLAPDRIEAAASGCNARLAQCVELDRINRPDTRKLKRLAGSTESSAVFLELAGYAVDEEAMPERREVDLILALAKRDGLAPTAWRDR